MSAAVTTAKPNCSDEYQIFRSGVFHEAEAGHFRSEAMHFFRAPGGYIKCLPTAAISPEKCARWHFQNADGREKTAKPHPVDRGFAFHRARQLIIGRGNLSSAAVHFDGTVSGELKMYRLRGKECHYLLRPRNARVPGTTSVISGTPGHCWLNKSGSDLLSHLVGQYHRRARA